MSFLILQAECPMQVVKLDKVLLHVVGINNCQYELSVTRKKHKTTMFSQTLGNMNKGQSPTDFFTTKIRLNYF